MDTVSESPFISFQPTQFTPHSTVIHFRQEKPAEPNSGSRIRRFHHKTRTGCRECKQKRRKCNEGKPSCQGCIKSGIDCHYEDVIPPRVQPKNRKKPTRKPAPNRFVFIEFGENGANSQRALASNTDLTSSAWQSAPSTCLLQGGLQSTESRETIALEAENLYLFRNFTYRTLPLQTYNKKLWAQVTFEISYSHTFLYNIIVALGASHQRYLKRESSRSPQEITHYNKALTNFRAKVSDPKSIQSVDPQVWISVLTTAALLSMYIMSSPVENFDVSCDTYFSLTRGTMNLLAESARKGLALPVPASQIRRRVLECAEPTLTMDFPGIDYAATGEDRAIGELTARKLASVLTALSVEDRSSMDTPTVVNLLKMGLEWAASAEASLIRQFRAKHKKAYIITAHFYAGMWKIREIIKGLCQRGLWQEESGTVDSFWWMLTPKILCKKAVELLPGEPRERLSWVHDTIRELDTD